MPTPKSIFVKMPHLGPPPFVHFNRGTLPQKRGEKGTGGPSASLKTLHQETQPNETRFQLRARSFGRGAVKSSAVRALTKAPEPRPAPKGLCLGHQRRGLRHLGRVERFFVVVCCSFFSVFCEGGRMRGGEAQLNRS